MASKAIWAIAGGLSSAVVAIACGSATPLTSGDAVGSAGSSPLGSSGAGSAAGTPSTGAMAQGGAPGAAPSGGGGGQTSTGVAGTSAGGMSGSMLGSSGMTSVAGTSSAGSSSAGATSGGGVSAGGQGAGGQGAGGQGVGGSGTGGGSAGASAVGGPPVPSTGCGNAAPNPGSSGSPLTVDGHQYYVKTPSDYDENTPYPVLFMFNPTGNPISWAEQNAGFESNGARDAWIRVYPHPANSGSGWGAGDVGFFEPLFEEIVGGYCVDEARVFAAGESSGGDFSSILGCEHADKIRAIGPCATKPVGGYSLDAESRPCTGQVAAVIIHGANDSVVGTANGPATRDFYQDLNHCGDDTVPVEGYTDDLSNCVEYQGCDAGYPMFWCWHQDPNYGGTNHGWPGFAADMLFETFSQY